ncbi:MAG: hypothetical protein V5A46_06105 [Haloferacaceae archaeon]
MSRLPSALASRLEGRSEEQIALGAGAVTLIVVNLTGTAVGIQFPGRTIVAIAAGFLALTAVSYLRTGNLLPESEDGEYEPEL